MSQVRYGAWHGGPDPLEPPFDIRQALDDIGDDVLAGMSPRSALNRLMRLGPGGRNGLDALRAGRAQPSSRATPQPPAGRHARASARAARRGRGRGAEGALPGSGRQRPHGRSRTGRAAEGHLTGGAGSVRLPMALARGAREVPADPGPAAQRGARRPVRRHARRHAVGHSGGPCAGPGDDARAQRDARRRRAR